MNNWIEVSESRLATNFQTIQAAAGTEVTVLAVIKANAYGHGVETCAPMLVRAGATWLGVTCASEGVRVRQVLDAAGLRAEILIMCGFLQEDVPLIRQAKLTPVVWTPQQVEWLTGETQLKVHVEIDTGMGRQGVTPGVPLVTFLGGLHAAGLVVDGVFTHFCSSEVAGAQLTHRQEELFESVVRQLTGLGIRPTWIHAGNSSAIDNPVPDAQWIGQLAGRIGAKAMVRPGLALYGYTLGIEGGGLAKIRGELEPVMTWKAHVLAVRELATGNTVGYNAIFTAEKTMRVALLPVGYADGLRRELSSTNEKAGGWMMIRGRRAPILGRISMNLTVVDVSGIDGVKPGDEAVVLGDGVTADDHARMAGTIAYEILCGVHPCG